VPTPTRASKNSARARRPLTKDDVVVLAKDIHPLGCQSKLHRHEVDHVVLRAGISASRDAEPSLLLRWCQTRLLLHCDSGFSHHCPLSVCPLARWSADRGAPARNLGLAVSTEHPHFGARQFGGSGRCIFLVTLSDEALIVASSTRPRARTEGRPWSGHGLREAATVGV
jgi:hypothetical protein